MTLPRRTLKITDENGTNYSDLFADLDTDSIEIADAYGRHIIDAMVPNDSRSPRASADGPLGAVIVRWIQSHVDAPEDRYGWQYLDAADIHTISYLDPSSNELEFINVFGHVDGGKRGYRLRAIAEALDLLLELDESNSSHS